MDKIIQILFKYKEALIGGLGGTLSLCAFVWGIGLILGSVIGITGAKWKKTIGTTFRVTSFFFSGIPILVLLVWLHYPLQEILNITVKPFYTAVLAFSLVNTFTVAVAVRQVILDFPEQYVIAAKVCGMSNWDTITRIQLPIVLRQLIPTLLIIQVNMLQASLFASVISVEELFRVAQRINALEYRPVEIYSALALFFLAICLPLNGLAQYLRGRYTRNLSEK